MKQITINNTTYQVIARSPLKGVTAIAVLIVRRPKGTKEHTVLEFANGGYRLLD